MHPLGAATSEECPFLYLRLLWDRKPFQLPTPPPRKATTTLLFPARPPPVGEAGPGLASPGLAGPGAPHGWGPRLSPSKQARPRGVPLLPPFLLPRAGSVHGAAGARAALLGTKARPRSTRRGGPGPTRSVGSPTEGARVVVLVSVRPGTSTTPTSRWRRGVRRDPAQGWGPRQGLDWKGPFPSPPKFPV